MPRYPYFADRNDLISGSVFEKFAARMAAQGENLMGLHIGDSYASPPYELPIDGAFRDAHPGFNRYCDTFGIRPLREAVADKLNEDNGFDIDAGHVMMTSGASNALNVSVQTLVNPGEEVLLLSPFWPFFRGMVRAAGATAVEVPFYTDLIEGPDLDIAARIEPHITDKTVAVHVNTPNNPSGKVLDRRHLQQVADVARRHDLWVLSDEAYEGMTFDGREHFSIATLPEMFERTLSIYSFSKVYMFSGLRLGYVVTQPDTIRNLNKTMVHQLYGPSTLGQQMMVEPVKTRKRWHGEFVRHCETVRNRVGESLRIRPRVPEGAYYFFFSIAEHLNGRDYGEVIDACLDAGVSVAPGEDFGRDYGDYIRICFAAEPPDRVQKGIERLNKIFPA